MKIVKQLVIWFLAAGLIVAFLKVMNWDFIAALEWLFNKAIEIIFKIADAFKGTEGFNKLFK